MIHENPEDKEANRTRDENSEVFTVNGRKKGRSPAKRRPAAAASLLVEFSADTVKQIIYRILNKWT